MKLDSNELAAVHAAATRMEIPHSQLRLSEAYQARGLEGGKQDPEVLELKATIQAMGGLLQNLVVVAAPDGSYEVCAGGRRWTALGLLIADGVFSADYPVPCLVIPAAHAHHASLIENIGRKAMHPADVYTAYARLRDENWTVAAIAAAHGASEAAVKKLLALGSVSSKLMQLFREGKVKMDEMQALASVSDHARQEAAWQASASQPWNRAYYIRQLLAETEMRGDSPVARFVTVAAYEKAGGEVRRDLFENDAYLADPEKVRSMADAKMQRSKLFKAVQAEGWLWVECRLSFEHTDKKPFGEIPLTRREPTKDEAKSLKALQTKLAKVADSLGELEQDDDRDEDKYCDLIGEHERLEEQIDALQDTFADYPADLKALAGAVLHLNYQGELTVTRGLIRQDERDAVAQAMRSNDGDGQTMAGVDLPPVMTRPVHSEALTNRLQAQRVIALQAEIMARPTLALCLLLEQMLGDFDGSRRSSAGDSFDISMRTAHHELANTDADIKNSSAWAAVHAQIEAVTKNVPGEDAAVLPWLLEQPQPDLIELLAVLASVSLYLRQSHSYGAEPKHLDRLAGIIDLDMSKWWKPTTQSYLAHVSKDRLAAVVTEAVDAEQAKPLLAMKKAQAAAAAEQLLEGKRWVPELMRTQPLEVSFAVEHPIGEMED
ncbi:ParB/RepB/Spo0J family partition protein [Achromobacter sp. SLBN-14]|uniref:ParB/RepB/Spo0J family partition protein n=1 Tax=Achromobacter sp. SLBN-14 TaxID=2768442 RepID=UPI00114EBFDC|nr:ParB/RepB/Spo0J family partition protein [Achromobacter sp. SLBN-14]TQJ94678.1 ParB family chromosome partitioning protein [Achromobacter sp. SLBN-14]